MDSLLRFRVAYPTLSIYLTVSVDNRQTRTSPSATVQHLDTSLVSPNHVVSAHTADASPFPPHPPLDCAHTCDLSCQAPSGSPSPTSYAHRGHSDLPIPWPCTTYTSIPSVQCQALPSPSTTWKLTISVCCRQT